MHVCQPLRKVPCIDLDNEEFLHSKVGVIKCSAPRCNKMFDTVAEHAAHQRACHNYGCSLCKQSFPSHHLLDLHLLEVHDSLFQLMAERRPMYQCLLETCPEKFPNALERKGHCIRLHKFPADFRYDLNWRKLGKEKKNRNGTKPNQNETSASMEYFAKSKAEGSTADIIWCWSSTGLSQGQAWQRGCFSLAPEGKATGCN
ncbi:hypothetical protein C7M84_012367 [Penaeus vannamei]|uniref:C2H2-type domain-containing protein n=1 Tax=Penaeus vannamei TaxID=6689 RepID=A0A3R7NXH8_PENVA|nr:hypothetical protein C7M84_012367 [Penaeus vannamei]